jgi:uncharacterized protein YndB with AHSA1/START domain
MGDDYRLTIRLRAPIEAVFDALTTPQGLRSWWGTDARVATAAGGEIRFNWSADSHVVFRIERLRRPSEVDWSCVAQRDENLPHPDEWVGTRLSFRLDDDAGLTTLAFVHHGLQPRLACYERCESGWNHFLGDSLSGLVERGTGLPYDPAMPGR